MIPKRKTSQAPRTLTPSKSQEGRRSCVSKQDSNSLILMIIKPKKFIATFCNTRDARDMTLITLMNLRATNKQKSRVSMAIISTTPLTQAEKKINTSTIRTRDSTD